MISGINQKGRTMYCPFVQTKERPNTGVDKAVT